MFNPLNLISKLIKSSNQKELDRIKKIVEKINSLEEKFITLTDDEFPKKTIEYKDQIKSKTKGVVDSYNVISSEKLENNTYKVELSVSIVKFKPSKSSNRKRIAVLDLKHRNDCCRVGNVKINGEAISEELTAGISSYLVQTRKFTVLDRAYESFISKGIKPLVTAFFLF